MHPKKKEHPKEKSGLHPRNKHRERYDFKQLIASCPQLNQFVRVNEYGDESIDFFNPDAVKTLNKALLKHFYAIDNWDIPAGYLCPPIPGRADYIHHIADLLHTDTIESTAAKIAMGSKITCLDIGVGANCVYPLIGNKEYGWSFIGCDIDPLSIAAANKIIDNNSFLKEKISLRIQPNAKNIFTGIIKQDELIDISICNPPFHSSLESAREGTLRKLKNLRQKKTEKPVLNFGGQNNELWCKGGEEKFIENMIFESKQFADSCFWFSTLVSKQENLKNTYEALKKVEAVEVKTIPMHQGNKTSRIVAWTFLNLEQQKKWKDKRWE